LKKLKNHSVKIKQLLPNKVLSFNIISLFTKK